MGVATKPGCNANSRFCGRSPGPGGTTPGGGAGRWHRGFSFAQPGRHGPIVLGAFSQPIPNPGQPDPSPEPPEVPGAEFGRTVSGSLGHRVLPSGPQGLFAGPGWA